MNKHQFRVKQYNNKNRRNQRHICYQAMKGILPDHYNPEWCLETPRIVPKKLKKERKTLKRLRYNTARRTSLWLHNRVID